VNPSSKPFFRNRLCRASTMKVQAQDRTSHERRYTRRPNALRPSETVFCFAWGGVT
jgi:hypothetical protein